MAAHVSCEVAATVIDGMRPPKVKFAADLYGAFPVKRLLLVFAHVLCSERERPFFIPLPAIQFAERSEGSSGGARVVRLTKGRVSR